jgi:hypothetical protein
MFDMTMGMKKGVILRFQGDLVVLFNGLQTADTIPGKNTNTIRIGRINGQSGFVQGHACRCHRVLHKKIKMPRQFGLDKIFRVKILDLSCNFDAVISGVKACNKANPAFSCTQIVPGLFSSGAQRGDQTGTCHYYPAFHSFSPIRIISCILPWPETL